MNNLLKKELRLSASPVSLPFTLFGLMAFLPGYPILCGAFFVTLGIFQSFRNMCETNDIVFSALLPIRKRDVVKGKYLFACLLEAIGLLWMAAAVALRMTVFRDAAVYRENALMNANLFALGMALLLFGVFNAVLIGGFFKTAYRYTRPFLFYSVGAFAVIALAEALWHFPRLSALNAFETEHFALQCALLLIGAAVYALLTLLSCRKACKRFEKTDL